jgi:apolipoprotein N-acyltransferase
MLERSNNMESVALSREIRRSGRPTVVRVFGIIALLVSLAELVLCFAGPIAFIHKPTLVLFPPFSIGLTEDEISRTVGFIEREIALTNSFSIVSQSSIENYFVRTDPDFDSSRLKPVNHADAHRIAQELGLERFAIAIIYRYSGQCELTVSIRDVRDGETVRSCSFHSSSLENLLKKIGTDGKLLEIQKGLAVETRAVTFTDFLVLGLLGLQIILGLLALFGRDPGVLVEITLAPALILFVFAYIYANNANMDYVQRYIATRGQLHLAKSTALEQLYAFLRFGPVLLTNGAYYVWRTIKGKRREHDQLEKHRLHRYVKTWALPWVVLSAVLFALSFPSFVSLEGYGVLAWFSLVPLLLVLITAKPSMGVFYGVIFGTLQALIINFWHGTYDYVTLHLITIAFVVEYLLFMVVLVWLIRMSGKWGFLVVPAAWTLFDYLRSSGILGYPWGLIGTTQYSFLPLIQIASLTGVWGIGFVVLLCNASLAWALAAPAFGWTWIGKLRVPPRVRELFPMKAFAVIFVICLVGGSLILHAVQERLYHHSETPRATVVLVQPNFDARKYVLEDNIRELKSLTDGALATLPAKPDLIAWPEGEFELDIRYWTKLENRKSYWGRIVEDFLDYQKNMGTWLLTGTIDHRMLPSEAEGQKREYFNSSVLLDPEGRIVDYYHKINLVPFSEYFPLDKEKFAGLYELFQNFEISNWGVGEERLVFQHEKMRIATPICFEDVFSDHVRRFVIQDVDIILNLSNDYWSLSPVEGRQHGILALFRAVENQRPVLRSTASGYTLYIDAAGRIQPGALEHYTTGYTIAQVPLPEKVLTLYTMWGDWFPVACGLAVIVFLARCLVAFFATIGVHRVTPFHNFLTRVLSVLFVPVLIVCNFHWTLRLSRRKTERNADGLGNADGLWKKPHESGRIDSRRVITAMSSKEDGNGIQKESFSTISMRLSCYNKQQVDRMMQDLVRSEVER